MKRKILKILLICSIIIIVALAIANASDLLFDFKEITIGDNTFKPMTDALGFHFSVVDYDAKDGDTKENSLSGPLIEDSEVNVKWYGRYHMNLQYNLVNFIEYCHSKYASEVENYCRLGDISLDPVGGYDYAKVLSCKGQIAAGNIRTVLNNFWAGMSSIPDFDILQDEFILKQYIKPAINKLELTNAQYKKAFGVPDYGYCLSANEVGGDNGQLITALLTMVYSDFWTADLTTHTVADVKRGDLVPFLYNVDEVGNDPYEIAKYAYIAYIYGFDVAGRTDGFHYWEQEFETVFPNENYDLTDEQIEKYQQKYDKMSEILSGEKGNKGGRLLGANIDTIIKGDYNINTQVSAVRSKIQNILNGFEMETTYEELIAKNYLMVKHMMDNDHINTIIKDYENGTIFRNETSISQGQVDEKNTKTALLTDFQLVEVSGKNLQSGRGGDTDFDGVLDGDELGPEPTEWSDITSIVKAAMKLDSMTGDIPVSKALNWEKFNESIKIEWEDASKSKVKKVLAKLYKYKSNPNLKDTDFDGIEDGNGWAIFGSRVDQEPLNNNFKGSSMTTRDGNLNIDFNTDFRYLMHKDTKYNDELAQQSLIMANLAQGETITLRQRDKNYGTMGIEEYISKMGFESVSNELVYNEDNVIVNCYIGYKSLDYYKNRRGIVGVFINTNESVEAYRKLAVDSDVISGNIYDTIAKKVYEKIDITRLMSLEPEYNLDYCYWITGKGLAGGVATEVAYIIRHEKDTSKDIYCYTFGAPKTHTGVNYTDNFIKNIINEDDFLTKVIQDDKGYRNGYTYNASVYSELIYNYKKLTRNDPKYTGNYMNMNTLNNYIWMLYSQISSMTTGLKEDISKLLSKYIGRTNNEEDFNNVLNYVDTYLTGIQMKKQINNKELETASSTKAYWTLAKVLEGLDEKTVNQKAYKKTRQEAESEKWDYEEKNDILDAIKELGVWYVNHITTYQSKLYKSSRSHYQRGTEPAHEYLSQYADYTIPNISGNYSLTIHQGQDELIESAVGSRFSYKFTDLFNYAQNRGDTTGNPTYAGYVGDDCNSFVMGVVRLASEGDRGQDENGTNRIESDGMDLQNTSAADMASADDFEVAMINLGYNKYAFRHGRWVKFVNNNGTITQRPLTEVYGDPNFEMSIDFLEPGDILCKSGHVEFYLGYNYTSIYNGKQIEDSFVRDKQYGIESIEIGNKAVQGHSTFGWGGVQNEFPKQNYYFTYENNSFVWNAGDYTESGYQAIWRKN